MSASPRPVILEAVRDAVRLLDYFPLGETPAWGLWVDDGGARHLERSCAERTGSGWRRTLDRFLVEGELLKGVDRTVFELAEDRFAEVAQYRSQEGRNLHARPIELPGSMRPGRPVHPFGEPGPSVTIVEAGVGRLADGAPPLRLLRLEASEGGSLRTLWLAHGSGEIHLSSGAGRWRTREAWTCGESDVLAPVPHALLEREPGPLPLTDDAAVRRSLF